MTSFSRPRQPGASLAHHAVPRSSAFQPIPQAYRRTGPFVMDLSAVLPPDEIQQMVDAGAMSFHCLGDTGGVKNPSRRNWSPAGWRRR